MLQESLVGRSAIATVLRGVPAEISSVMLVVFLAARYAVGSESPVRGNVVPTMLRGVPAAIPSVMLPVILAAKDAVELVAPLVLVDSVPPSFS